MQDQNIRPSCTYILLAAGFSKRFGEEDKRRALIEGQSMLELVIRRIPITSIDELIVVVRNKDEWSHLQENQNLVLVENHGAEKGFTTSIKVGLDAMSIDSKVFMICLADMPLLQESHYECLMIYYCELIQEMQPLIVLPMYSTEIIGHPRLFSRAFLEAFLENSNSESNKGLLAKYDEYIKYFHTSDRAFIHDVDTQNDLSRLNE